MAEHDYGLIFAPKHNHRRKDATGAFHPEARALAALRPGLEIVYIDNHASKAEQARAVIDAILAKGREEQSACCGDGEHAQSRVRRLTAIAFFCHGYRTGIQLGFNLRNVGKLAAAIAEVAETDLVLPLYCCSTASPFRRSAPGGDGGFADRLRDALCERGVIDCVVDAHVTAGHTTWNPHVRRFAGLGSPLGGVGGPYIVAPGSKGWREWRRALRASNVRLQFPWWTTAEIHERLAALGA